MEESLLEPEFAEQYNAWSKTPTPENSSVLLKAINPVLTASMRSAVGTNNSPTLHSRAKIMALDAMKRYDPTKAKLRTHLMFQLQGLRRYAARENQILSVPEQVGLDLHHVRTSENELRDTLGRDPSEAEVSDHVSLSPKRLAYIRNARNAYSEGSFNRNTGEGEDYYSPSVQDKSNVQQWHEFVYHDLAPIDQVIMEHTLGLHGKQVLPNQDVARKLNISPGAVSQRKAKIQQKLDMRDELKVI
jgi:DNA-directed RNA polymerase specialized sigma subunit